MYNYVFYNGINMTYYYSIPFIWSIDNSSENGPSFVEINNNYCVLLIDRL